MNYIASRSSRETISNGSKQHHSQRMLRGVSENFGADAPPVPATKTFDHYFPATNPPVSQIRQRYFGADSHVSVITLDPDLDSDHGSVNNDDFDSVLDGTIEAPPTVSDYHSTINYPETGATATTARPCSEEQVPNSDQEVPSAVQETTDDQDSHIGVSIISPLPSLPPAYNPEFVTGTKQREPVQKAPPDLPQAVKIEPSVPVSAELVNPFIAVGRVPAKEKVDNDERKIPEPINAVDEPRRKRKNRIGKIPEPDELMDESRRKRKNRCACILICLIVALLAGAGAGYYFYLRPLLDKEVDDSPVPTVPTLVESSIFPLLRCQGDCDGDTDCQDGLYCFQRHGGVPVPGCAGEDSSNNDYCIPAPEGLSIERYGEPLLGAYRTRFGSSISQSKDGQILAVGGLDQASDTGYIKIYKSQPNKSWALMATLTVVTDSARFGSSIALSANGSTLVAGSQMDFHAGNLGTRVARAHVFSASSDFRKWNVVGNEIIGDAYVADEFNYSVDVSSKGDFVALGQPNSNRLQGGPAIYRIENGRWTYIGSPFSQFQSGFIVKLSETASGNLRVAVNGDNSHFGPGQVYVLEFDTSDGGWRSIGQSLGENIGGASIALSDDGSMMALSITDRRSIANNMDGPNINGPEYVLVYQYNEAASTWVQFGNLISIPSVDILHLPSISLSQDGHVLAIGEPWYNGNNGRVTLRRYDRNSEIWELLDDVVEASVDGGFFGASLSLVGPSDNFKLAVGAPLATVDDVTQGSTWSYQLDP